MIRSNVIAFAPGGDQRRNVLVEWPELGRSALVQSRNEDPEATAAWLSELPTKLAEAEREVTRLRRALPPPQLERLIGTGCIREDRNGPGLWLLACASKGWSAFGIRLDGWDDLFRRYDVIVDVPRVDEFGIWWPAVPREVRS